MHAFSILEFGRTQGKLFCFAIQIVTYLSIHRQKKKSINNVKQKHKEFTLFADYQGIKQSSIFTQLSCNGKC